MIYKTEIENTITIQRLCFTSTYIESSPHVMVIQILVYCPVHQLKKLNCNCGYDTSLLCGILAVINLTDTIGYSFNQVRHTNPLVIDNNYIFFSETAVWKVQLIIGLSIQRSCLRTLEIKQEITMGKVKRFIYHK
jgi:hypothetical protein